MILLSIRSSLILAFVLAFASLAHPAFAGPPLLCHPFDIDSARSLPWGSGWSQEQPGYDLSHLTADTVALLAPSTPVVVRMETLRRAAIYASRDRAIAGQLLARLMERTSNRDADHRREGLAWLDAAYLTEAFRQIGYLGSSSMFGARATQVAALVADADGRGMIEKALVLSPGDPGLEFAAALINADKDRAAYLAHAKKARAAAAQDELVARNLTMLE